jgi:hypothetical protein
MQESSVSRSRCYDNYVPFGDKRRRGDTRRAGINCPRFESPCSMAAKGGEMDDGMTASQPRKRSVGFDEESLPRGMTGMLDSCWPLHTRSGVSDI